ncbi:MAG TPA: hypothetical protein P5200_10525 [Tenuifilaceae bacterium]|nr:hypothetical protein [Tenuifilaceae bacterium]
MKIIRLLALLLLFSQTALVAQEQSDSTGKVSPVRFSSSVVSRYVWRGILFEATPHIQPTMEYRYKGFSVGVWGSYGISDPFAEIDLFASYTYGYFTATIFDYFIENESNLNLNSYFVWKNSTSPHALEGTISFNGTENFPLTLTAATFFYGNDRDQNNDNFFSTYLEIGYSVPVKASVINLKIGGTPSESIYANKTGIVNCSLGLCKDIKVTNHFSLPVFSEFIVNPAANDVFFVFGVTL